MLTRYQATSVSSQVPLSPVCVRPEGSPAGHRWRVVAHDASAPSERCRAVLPRDVRELVVEVPVRGLLLAIEPGGAGGEPAGALAVDPDLCGVLVPEFGAAAGADLEARGVPVLAPRRVVLQQSADPASIDIVLGVESSLRIEIVLVGGQAVYRGIGFVNSASFRAAAMITGTAASAIPTVATAAA